MRKYMILTASFFLFMIFLLLYINCNFNVLNHNNIGKMDDLYVKVLNDGRYMEVTKDFLYVDSHGIKWPVPKGTITDGASIPKPFWSIIGSPFVGKYRKAAVIHDYYCHVKNRHWKAVHRVFLDAMLSNGVNQYKAKLMYIAVYRFGPRWDFDANSCFCKGCPKCAHPVLRKIKFYRSKYNKEDFLKLIKILKIDGDLEKAERLADYQIYTEIFSNK